MARTELIVGGDFQNGGVFPPHGWDAFQTYGQWFGNNMEIGQANLYLDSTSTTDYVVEMDGVQGQTTTVAQTFNVAEDNQSALLSFDLTGRNGKPPEPIIVEVLDANQLVIFSETVEPTNSGSFRKFEIEFDFGTAGDYTLRFSEDPSLDDNIGSILDNVSLTVCFTRGTEITTCQGEMKIEDLKVGDLVETLDDGLKAIKWISSKKLSRIDLIFNPNMRPILIRKNALGRDMPREDLRVSPQHRLLIRSKVAKRVLGDHEALVPAKKLVGTPRIEVDESLEDVEYFHFALESHSIVTAQTAYAETLYLGSQACKMLDADTLSELKFLFPKLFETEMRPPPARPFHSGP